jgi:hypothetical protein
MLDVLSKLWLDVWLELDRVDVGAIGPLSNEEMIIHHYLSVGGGLRTVWMTSTYLGSTLPLLSSVQGELKQTL